MQVLKKQTAKGALFSLFFLYLSLVANYANAQWRPISQVGLRQTPPLQLNNLAGEAINIDTFKGNVVLVNFWASWCEPCREEFTELTHLQEKYGAKGFKILAINLAEMKPRIIQFLKGNSIPENSIEILQDRSSIIYKTWKARGIPTTSLLNKQGKIISVWFGAIDNADSEEVTEKIETLLR